MTLKALLKKSKITYNLARALKKTPEPLLTLWLNACHGLLGVEKNKVYFSSFSGMLCNDNPRAVCEALHKICPETKIVFRMNSEALKHDLPDYIIPLPRFSLKTFREMATARVIVKNADMKSWMRRFPDQYYIQTWHGDRGFKKILMDKDSKNASDICRKSKQISLAISGSDFGSQVYRSAFGYEGEILECGCPRNDILVNNPPETAAQVRAELGIPADVKILMYAPTFRNSSSGSSQQALLSLDKVRRLLEETTGGKWLCISRGHALTRGIQSDAGMDLSDYPDISRLLLITDMLISDYSSIAGDYMLLGRPAIFYQPDLKDYLSERGLYFNPDESPLVVAHSETELLDILSSPRDWTQNCKDVLGFFGTHESGQASEIIAARISAFL